MKKNLKSLHQKTHKQNSNASPSPVNPLCSNTNTFKIGEKNEKENELQRENIERKIYEHSKKFRG